MPVDCSIVGNHSLLWLSQVLEGKLLGYQLFPHAVALQVFVDVFPPQVCCHQFMDWNPHSVGPPQDANQVLLVGIPPHLIHLFH